MGSANQLAGPTAEAKTTKAEPVSRKPGNPEVTEPCRERTEVPIQKDEKRIPAREELREGWNTE